MSISERLKAIRSTLPQGVELVAVSKFHPMEALREAFDAGQRLFGESRVQELTTKVASLTEDEEDVFLTGGQEERENNNVTPGIHLDQNSCPSCSAVKNKECSAVNGHEWRWHFIGHLQTNKVRQLLRLRPALIESVDSEHLLDAIDKEAAAQGIVQPVLMQLHVAQEETKTGFLPEELLDYFRERRFEKLNAVHICGVMGMASNTDDTSRIEADFCRIRSVFDEILRIAPDLRGFDTVSMGMSDDYPLAIRCGSTLVRVGTAIFGAREY